MVIVFFIAASLPATPLNPKSNSLDLANGLRSAGELSDFRLIVRISKSQKCHVVLMIIVVDFSLLPSNFVLSPLFLDTIVKFCKRVHDTI